MPVPKDELPLDVNEITCDVLPYDGRLVVLEDCQICHNLEQVVLQDKNILAWYIHSEILTEQRSQALATYLSINMPVPREKIPEALLRNY